MSTHTPKARKERLVLRDLSEELLVCDLERHEASCLNWTASPTTSGPSGWRSSA